MALDRKIHLFSLDKAPQLLQTFETHANAHGLSASMTSGDDGGDL